MVAETDIDNCMECPTRCTTEWQVLGVDELAQVEAAKRAMTYQPGERYFPRATPVAVFSASSPVSSEYAA